ncbi:hypothetical protein HL667_05380 [Bradyrhizobium sp. 83012]|uniref:Uncharacterized protein n=1 Tax=Bradyrhizobium aeschynomenes TaxID=2734909 RepID=A0ABX2C9I4_9BRAD|nr:hypothetical protein [Bradyrhizobium aeschynomenes]NPU64423.1 hypothetical protein [Bradyrhizobium aeschynomenes]
MRIGFAVSTLSVVMGSAVFGLGLTTPRPAQAFLEDICIPRVKDGLKNCIAPASACKDPAEALNRSCLLEAVQFALIPPGRSMIHADSTYFIAQALGYRADVAYWIAAYNENADYAQYKPIDQCGGQASSTNSGASYITASFNGFQRTNASTAGPLYHYLLNFSPNGQGTDVHGASGVQAVYPFHYPPPGYPITIDSVYQGTLYDLRQWAMKGDEAPGLLCTVGYTVPNGSSNFSGPKCLSGATISGTVPLLENYAIGPAINVASGPKVLDNSNTSDVVDYTKLKSFLDDKSKTTGVLFDDPKKPPVPVQIARIGLYLHSLQDASSHGTFCGDDAPSPPGGSDAGSYMYLDSGNVKLVFGTYCATGPHLASHVQETGTGDVSLPLRDYVALNNTVDELILFGNNVAKPRGWIVNPSLLPPNVVGGKSAAGDSAADLKSRLVGRIVQGVQWSRAEVYASGVITAPLQRTDAQDRLNTMNAALGAYSKRLTNANSKLTPLRPMPGNSFDPNDKSVCFK